MIARLALGLTLAAALIGCGNDDAQPQLGMIAAKRVQAKITGAGPDTADLPTVDQLRAAAPEFRAQAGGLPLILASSMRLPVASIMFQTGVNGDVRTYFTPDGISFALRNGVLVASRGLGTDLMRADVAQVLPRVRAGSGQATRVHVYLDGENQEVRHSYRCDYARVGGEVVESCRGDHASFENRYVVRNGVIAVSVQWVSPKLGSYRIEDLG